MRHLGAAWQQVCISAGAWVVLFQLNNWLFGSFEWAQSIINWVFLPAAVRLLSVMLFGWSGAMGIWLGTLCTTLLNPGQGIENSLVEILSVASISTIGPLLAVSLTIHYLKIPVDLQGLTAKRLIVFAVMGALCNVVVCNVFFWAIGITGSPFEGLVPMFVGDLLGTLIVFYTLRGLLMVLEHFVRQPSY